jgi:hypothetical protein
MKSIRWIQKLFIDDKPGSIEILIGQSSIADRCYVRVNQEPEFWYTTQSGVRAEIIQQGLEIIQKQLANHKVTSLDGTPYNWTAP